MSEYVGTVIIPYFRHYGTKINKEDRWSRLLLALTMYLPICIAFYCAFSNIAVMPSWTFFPGIFLIILGIVIRQWSVAVLGSFFSLDVGTQKGQKIVKKGPYKLVGHPSYTGILLIVLGIGLTLQSWAGFIIIILGFGIGFGYRIQVEEKLLVSKLGDDYINYMKNTKRLIPYIIL